jgi:hypothetical protein
MEHDVMQIGSKYQGFRGIFHLFHSVTLQQFHSVTLQQFNNITVSLTTDLLSTPQHGLTKDHKTFHKPSAFILHSEAGDNVTPEHWYLSNI